MANLPVICNGCGTFFLASSPIVGSCSVSFIGCGIGPCPKCGGMGEIFDGIYDLATNTARLLLKPGTSKNHLLILQKLFIRAREKNYSSGEVREKVKAEVPELQSLGECLPKTRMELYTFLGFVIALIAYITSSAISLLNSNDKVSEAEIEKVVKHALEAEIAKSTVKAPVSKKIKVGRNEPCSCGSGKKHKKCCLLKK